MAVALGLLVVAVDDGELSTRVKVEEVITSVTVESSIGWSLVTLERRIDKLRFFFSGNKSLLTQERSLPSFQDFPVSSTEDSLPSSKDFLQV